MHFRSHNTISVIDPFKLLFKGVYVSVHQDFFYLPLTRAPLGLLDFHALLGGGGV